MPERIVKGDSNGTDVKRSDSNRVDSYKENSIVTNSKRVYSNSGRGYKPKHNRHDSNKAYLTKLMASVMTGRAY